MEKSIIHSVGRRVFGPVSARVFTPPWAWLRRVPFQTGPFHPTAPWPQPSRDTPDVLLTAPVWRDPEAEERAFDERPLHQVAALWPDALRWVGRNAWDWMIPAAPTLLRGIYRTKEVWASKPAEHRSALDDQALTASVLASAPAQRPC